MTSETLNETLFDFFSLVTLGKFTVHAIDKEKYHFTRIELLYFELHVNRGSRSKGFFGFPFLQIL